MKITILRTTPLVVPLPAPIMSGLGPLATTGVLLVHPGDGRRAWWGRTWSSR